MRTNKLSPHMTPGPGIEPGTHWWKASALTTAPTLLPWVCKRVLRSNKTDLWKQQCSSKVNLVDIASLFIIWPARRAGKINQILRPELSCPLRTTRRVPQEKFRRKSYNKFLTKVVRSSWLDIVLVLFLRVYGPRLRLGPKTRKKGLGQYPAILTSCWFETWRFQIRIFYPPSLI